MFDDFQLVTVDVADDVSLRVRLGGSGPPVVLLHGHPRTHTTWYRVAPLLAAAGFTVVCPDLRGAGAPANSSPSSSRFSPARPPATRASLAVQRDGDERGGCGSTDAGPGVPAG